MSGFDPQTQILSAQLSALALGLCREVGVTLEVYPGPWRWDPHLRVIFVSQEDLAAHGPDYCAGVLAQEIGRVFISREHLLRLDFPSAAEPRPFIGAVLMDALEAARARHWMLDHYPGVEPWLRAVQEKSRPLTFELPHFVQLCEAIAQLERLRFGVLEALVGPLQTVWPLIEEYVEILPETSADPEEIKVRLARYRLHVQPALLTPLGLPTAREQVIRLSAVEALHFAQDHIYDVAEAAYVEDIERIERYLNDHPARAAQARRFLRQGELSTLLHHMAHHPGKKELSSRWAQPLAEEIFEAILRGLQPVRILQTDVVPSPDEETPVPAPAEPSSTPPPPVWYTPTPYERAYMQVAEQIDELARRLEEVLLPQRRLHERSGYASGRHIDLRKLVHFEADPRRYNELWVRSSIPDRHQMAITLLVDLSGSMRRQKIQSAVLGTILLSETLARLQVPFALYGFQDQLISLRSFEQDFDDEARRAIAEMPQEVEGCRTGGNNQPAYNDDGPCLREAAEELLGYPARDRLLIVVSDGLPEGRHSSEADLHTVIRQLTQPPTQLELIGLGLGPQTQHVREYYPQSVANVPVGRLSDEISLIIERALLGQGQSRPAPPPG